MMLLRLSCAASSASSRWRPSLAALRSLMRAEAALSRGVIIVQDGGEGGAGLTGGHSCTQGARTSHTARSPSLTAARPGVAEALLSTAADSEGTSPSASLTLSASTPVGGVTVTLTVTEPAGPEQSTSATCEGRTCSPACRDRASFSPASRSPTSEGLSESPRKSMLRRANRRRTQGPLGSSSSTASTGNAGCGRLGAARSAPRPLALLATLPTESRAPSLLLVPEAAVSAESIEDEAATKRACMVDAMPTIFP
mmetsp:Transcript_111215/g.295578  ORF Transcript_111215/g.295578 Transcript_111215/m.295578 type:complete len:254 (-) Transcript_111215:629-1390(-)